MASDTSSNSSKSKSQAKRATTEAKKSASKTASATKKAAAKTAVAEKNQAQVILETAVDLPVGAGRIDRVGGVGVLADDAGASSARTFSTMAAGAARRSVKTSRSRDSGRILGMIPAWVDGVNRHGRFMPVLYDVAFRLEPLHG